MSVAQNPNYSGSSYAGDRNEDGLLIVHGVALGDNDVTVGAKSGKQKLWRPEVLRGSAEYLQGKDIVVDHENRSAREIVGQVTKSKYKDGVGIIWEGVVKDDELETKIEQGWLDVSPRLLHSEEYDEVDGINAPKEIYDFPNLSIVRKGAAPSNELVSGEHEELSAEMLQGEFDGEVDSLEEYQFNGSRVELLQEVSGYNYSQWLYEGAQAAQGASEKFPCSGVHEHYIDDKTWYAPCSSHQRFLTALKEVEGEEMILSESRTPDYEGTETKSWGDIPADTLSYWTDALDYSDVEQTDDLTQEQKNEIASHTLLGDSEADNVRELRFFPVVNARTGNLNRGALEAVRSGRGQSADISNNTYESAYETAGRLLNEEFDTDVEEEMEVNSSKDFSRTASQLASHTKLTKSQSDKLIRTIAPGSYCNLNVLSSAISNSVDVEQGKMKTILSKMTGENSRFENMEEESLEMAASIIGDEWDVSTEESLQVINYLGSGEEGDLENLAEIIVKRNDFEGVETEDLMKSFDELSSDVSENEEDDVDEDSYLSRIIG